jgi:cytidylate kinase
VIVAIDGGVATGKSAVGRRVAERFGLPFVDSGLMYRAMARLVVRAGVDPADGAALTRLASHVQLRVDGDRVWTDGEELTGSLYDADLNESLTRVSKTAGVRLSLVAQQRAMAVGGVVMAGRDIGTVVFPDADFKFFLVASLEEKVRRRAAQYAKRGIEADPETMEREVRERDRSDIERTVAPLRAAPDAVIIETDNLDVDGVVETIMRRIESSSR